MAIVKEVASFDIDTKAAQKSINGYIDSLQKLEAQREKNIKLGKSTVQVNKQIDASIDRINKSLKQTSTTRKGQLAQLEATRKAQEQLLKSTQKRLVLDKKVEKQAVRNNKSLRSQRRAFGELKFLAIGAAVGIASALGNLGEAIDSVNNVLFPQIGLQNKVADATKSAALEYVKEKADLDNLFESAQDDTLSREERLTAINAINKEYGDYLPNLLTEKSSLDELTTAQDIATASILKSIVARQKVAIAEKLIQQIIDSRIDTVNRSAQANAGFAQTLEGVLGGLAGFLGSVTGLADISETVAGVGNKLDDLKSDSARKQLKLLSQTGDSFFIDFLKGFDELAGIFGDFQSDVDKTGKETGKATKNVKDLTGTIAGLTAKLNAAKKVLKEGIQVVDEDGLAEQQKIINKIEDEIQRLKDFLKTVGEEEIKLPKIDTSFIAEGIDQASVEDSLKIGLKGLKISDLRLKLERTEIEGLIDLDAIEKERNAALAIFRGTSEQRDALNETFNQKRLQREQQTTRAVIELQLKILQLEKDVAKKAGENLNAIDKEIAKLQLSLTELDAQSVNIDIDIDTMTLEEKAKKTKETLSTIVSGIEELGGQIISFFAQQAAATLSQLESDISRQEAILGELLSNQAGANAQQVQLERDRLDALVAQRKKATEAQAAIATTEIALNLAIAVARAAAEGGGIGSAFTIAALILAAGIGFIQARQQAQQAFAGGTDYLTAKGGQHSDGGISITAHKGEAIVQADKNKEYHPTVKAVRRGSVPAHLLNDFAKNYKSYRKVASDTRLVTPSMYRRMEAAGITLNGGGRNGIDKKFMESMISEQKKTRKAIQTLPIHQTKITERGLTNVVTSNQNHDARNNKRFR